MDNFTISNTETIARLGSTAPQPVESLTETDCWAYLNTNSLGRLAVIGKDGVDLFPINYLTHRSTVLFRTAPGSKLIDITDNPVVAFEIDGIDNGVRWSVVVRGEAVRLGSDLEILDTGVSRLATLSPTEKWNYVRVTPRTLTGRRFVAAV